jgi:membrane associated rhomboid family serine protease
MVMSPGPDLFVVCKQCGSEVSPYITECPYCGTRLQKRAPKLPREGETPKRPRRGSRTTRSSPSLGRLRRGEIPGVRADAPPYATAVLVVATCGLWVAWRGGYVDFGKLIINGPLHGDWWRLITSQFAYANGFYQFITLGAIALFGWLLERRHGPIVVIALFFVCGVTGALAEIASGSPLVSGGNGAALGLLAAWAVPDLLARKKHVDYDGDLLGVLAIAAVLLGMSLARQEASLLAGVVGGLVGLVLGYGLRALRPD